MNTFKKSPLVPLFKGEINAPPLQKRASRFLPEDEKFQVSPLKRGTKGDFRLIETQIVTLIMNHA
jgi:hypothetical protein